ncbi:MAG: hypothetical protein AAF626_18660 [Pseudomonadota bacterium]
MDALTVTGEALLELFIYALVIESALAVLFNWRVFKIYFGGRGLRTVIAIVVSVIVVYVFKIDVLGDLVFAFDGSPSDIAPEDDPRDRDIGKIITALVLAGGSGGVHNLLTIINFRPQQLSAVAQRQKELEDAQAAAGGNIAYVSITVNAAAGVGPIMISFEVVNSPPDDTRLVSGIVMQDPPPFSAMFRRNWNRFPNFGGYTLQANKAYLIYMTAEAQDGSFVSRKVYQQPVKFSKNAIIDLHAKFDPKAIPAPMIDDSGA